MKNLAQELFLLTTTLSQLSNKDRIIQLFIESMNDIFHEYSFSWFPDKSAECGTMIDVCTRRKSYGFISCATSSRIDATITNLINNAVQLLAIFLEKIEQESLLQDQKNHLQILVDERTSELYKVNTQLEKELTEHKRTEKALYESEEKYRTLIQKIQAAVVVHGPDTGILICNSKAQELLGLTEDQLLGKTAVDPEWYFFRDDGSRMPTEEYPVNRVMASGEPIRDIVAGVHRSSTKEDIWILISADPVTDRNGKISQVIVTFMDITDRKKATEKIRESEQRYRMVFENSPVSLWEEDFSGLKVFFDELKSKGVSDIATYLNQHPETFQRLAGGVIKFIDINQSTLDLHGATTKEELFTNIAHTVTPEALENFVLALERLWNGDTEMVGDSVIRTLKGERRNVTAYLSICPGYEKSFSKVLTSLIDITDRKTVEEELLKLKDELEVRVRERTAELQAKSDELNENQKALINIVEDLNDKSRELEIANKELEAFSYSVSHDMRAPLRVINGFCQILLREYLDILDEKGKEYLQRMHSATLNMTQLIDSLLSLSRVSRSEIHHLEVNLSEIARDICNILSESDPERKAAFTIKKDIKIMADPRLIRIVMENLLRNAWKFSSKKSSSQIEFGLSEQNGRTVYFIRDNGAGFDMKYAQKLFIAFQRLHSNTEFPGTGIGLATVQRIIQKHGGKIWAEGETDAGATFYFTI